MDDFSPGETGTWPLRSNSNALRRINRSDGKEHFFERIISLKYIRSRRREDASISNPRVVEIISFNLYQGFICEVYPGGYIPYKTPISSILSAEDIRSGSSISDIEDYLLRRYYEIEGNTWEKDVALKNYRYQEYIDDRSRQLIRGDGFNDPKYDASVEPTDLVPPAEINIIYNQRGCRVSAQMLVKDYKQDGTHFYGDVRETGLRTSMAMSLWFDNLESVSDAQGNTISCLLEYLNQYYANSPIGVGKFLKESYRNVIKVILFVGVRKSFTRQKKLVLYSYVQDVFRRHLVIDMHDYYFSKYEVSIPKNLRSFKVALKRAFVEVEDQAALISCLIDIISVPRKLDDEAKLTHEYLRKIKALQDAPVAESVS
ncbi:hypothetical protein IMCC3088_2362 [Aequoribacter fuscus]|uniref:Uncharacterized protein n=1 Tax=Aequoribacter fuscus TaxID=2518989 RepID=F3L3Y1_9GAMM|nr:hypothetical protein [Aequoribacter fuscus]EGG28964.1 hypothetical protein IMCC3088_2362 [Aequoribacter fuscus]QHJ87991.1 hypothetical protein EYZ66_06620 [Aequoribacter fuscus]